MWVGTCVSLNTLKVMRIGDNFFLVKDIPGFGLVQ